MSEGFAASVPMPVRFYQVMLETTTRSIPIAVFTHRETARGLAVHVDRRPSTKMLEVFGQDDDIGLRVSVVTLVHQEPVRREVVKVFEPEFEPETEREVLPCSTCASASCAASGTPRCSGSAPLPASPLG